MHRSRRAAEAEGRRPRHRSRRAAEADGKEAQAQVEAGGRGGRGGRGGGKEAKAQVEAGGPMRRKEAKAQVEACGRGGGSASPPASAPISAIDDSLLEPEEPQEPLHAATQ